MRTDNQVEVIVFKREKNKTRFLILKRNIKKGGFWQPVTGGVEEGETFEQAAIREVGEETGIINKVKLIDIGYSFSFFENDKRYFEKIFGAEILPGSKINLSSEHTEFKWVDGQTAIEKFLKYPGNIEGFRRLIEILKRREDFK